MTNRSDMIDRFIAQYAPGAALSPLAGDASFRRYIRVRHQEKSFMLMDAPPEKEDVRPFVAVAGALVGAGFSAPEIVAADEAQGLLLLEDLGDDTFSRLLRANPADEEEYYRAAVELLAAWHGGAMPAQALSLPAYDTALLTRELRLFPDWFLPQILDGSALADAQASYMALWQTLLGEVPLDTTQFVHRDYHADNLMWLPDREGLKRVGLLDFQDAVAGDAAYDLLSLLEDARRDVAPEFARKMMAHYVQKSGADAGRFALAYALLAAQRNSKIIGIFTRLAARDGKAHYLDFLPRVWAHLARDAEHPALGALKSWLDRNVPPSMRGKITIRKDASALGLAA